MKAFTTMGWLGTTFKTWAGVVDVNNIRWQGSYTINRYAGAPQTFLLLDITPMKKWLPCFWRAFPAHPSQIPVVLDGRSYGAYPGEYPGALCGDDPPYAPDAMDIFDDPWYGVWPYPMDRHLGHTNAVFRDGAVRKVGVKEMWTLKWHRLFDTAGPWTTAGGVQPGDWPEWMRKFKDY